MASIRKDKNSTLLFLLSFFELWERFSYYGVRGLLVIYLTSALGFTDAKAYVIYSLFAAIGYAVPVLAGIIADKLIGFQRTLIIGAFLMCLGHFSLALMPLLKGHLLYFSLSLIAIGTGFFKGNIANVLGEIYPPEHPLRDKGFTIFYVCINIGAAVSSIACGYVAHIFGWHYGFGLAGIGMLLGLSVFLRYRYLLKNYGMHPNERKPHSTKGGAKSLLLKGIVLSIALIVCSMLILYYDEFFAKYFSWIGLVILLLLLANTYNLPRVEKINVLALMFLAFFQLCFFALEMQAGSVVTLFSSRNVDRVIWGYEIPAVALQSINPLSVIVLGTIFSWIFAKFTYTSYIKRIGLGLLINVISLLSIYVGCYAAENAKVPIIYLVIFLVLQGIVEIFIAPLIMSLFTVLSPSGIKGFMMGILMFGISYANLAGIVISKFMSIPKEEVKDAFVSLNIYQDGFLMILIFNILVFVLFTMLALFLHRVIRKNYDS